MYNASEHCSHTVALRFKNRICQTTNKNNLTPIAVISRPLILSVLVTLKHRVIDDILHNLFCFIRVVVYNITARCRLVVISFPKRVE